MAARRSTWARVQRLAAELGVTVEHNPATGFYDAWSPAGQVFVASGCHVVAHSYRLGPWVAEVHGGMVADLEAGLEPCTEGATCDTCHPEE